MAGQAQLPKHEPQKPHPIVSDVIQQFRSKKPSGDSIYFRTGPFTIDTAPDQRDRVVNILTIFAATASEQSLDLKKDGAVWKLYASEESIDIKISEGFDKIPHIPTAAELRESSMYSWKKIRNSTRCIRASSNSLLPMPTLSACG